MNTAWYVLRSKPNKEHALYQQVLLQNYEVYYPRLRVKPVNPRARHVVPYFPGYMFVHVDLVQAGRSVFKWMPFSMGLVAFGSEPAFLPDAFIHALRTRLEEIHREGPHPMNRFRQGEKVLIRRGPFEGCHALFDEHISGGDRVKVLLEFLSGQCVRVDLDLTTIESIST